MTGKATWIGFTLAAVSAVWGGEAPVGEGPPKVGGEVEISNVPFDLNEVIRTVRKNRGLPEEPPKQGFRAGARGERPFVSKGNAFSHETPRFQAEVGEDGLRYFAQGSRGKPDFEIFSVSFEQGGVSQTVFGKGRLEEHAPGLLQGEAQGGVTPYVRNRGEEGVELYWTIDEPLSSETSALRVRFLIRAVGEPREHPEGLVFPALREEGQVILSNVTVADSAGRREGVRPLLATSREVLFEVSREFLETARYPVLIDPTVGPEFQVNPSPVIGPAGSHQGGPSVASNGTDYFVAWEDWRNWTSISDKNIYGARVASDGTVLDPTGIALTTAANDQEYPSVASNGTDYFVVWADYRSGTDYDIYGARVVSDGTVLDPTPTDIAVSTATNDQEYPSVASSGTDYFVAWQDLRSEADYDIYGARVRASDGLLLDGPPDTGGVAVSTAVDDQYNPSVASNGADYFVAWEDWRSGVDIYGARVASDGTVLDPAGILISTSGLDPSVASNGTDYFVAWEDWRSGSDYDIYGARVAPDGTVIDPSGIAVSTAAWDQEYPSVASNGTDYLVAWRDYRSGTEWDIYGARVTSAGVVLDPASIAVSTAADLQRYPSVASNGTDYFVVWEDARNLVCSGLCTLDFDIYGARVTSAGVVLDPAGIVVSTSANPQGSPSVASNGTDYFIAWTDLRGGMDSAIYGTRVAPDGTVLDPAGIAVSTAADNQWSPSVASNGTDYFVAWLDYRSGTDLDIYGARVASDGTVLDPTGIAVSTAADDQYWPSTASNGTDYFVAWQEGWGDIYGARVTATGVVLDTSGIAVSTAAGWQQYPSVASNGTDYFVAWFDARSGADYDIYGARVAPDGTLLDGPPDIGGIAVSTAADNQGRPSVTSNGMDYFVAWSDNRSGTDRDIYGARVASDGTVLDGPPDTGGIAVSTAADDQYGTAAASNGTDYFVVWEDYRSGTDDDVYGARVTSAAGTVLDAAGILIQQSLYDDFSPAVAYSACGKYLVTYQRFHDDPNFQSHRVMARTFYDDSSVINVEYDMSFDPVATLAETCGDGDFVVEPGERWSVTVQLVNNAPTCTAYNVKADLTANPGSAVAAGVCNNPGLYGSIPAGGTAQFAYSFVVDAGAVCINDITFDVTGIVSDEGAYPDGIAAFGVTVGQVTVTAVQATDPLMVKNGTASSLFAPVFVLGSPATSAELSYTLTHEGGAADLLDCTKVELLDPLAGPTLIKDFGIADPLKPVDVTAAYIGKGTYQLQLTEAGKGCGSGSATISSGTLSVSDTGCDVSTGCGPAPTITESVCDCFGIAVLDAGAGYASYLWSTGATTQTITALSDCISMYSVTVTDANGCQGTDSHLMSCCDPFPSEPSAFGVPPLTVAAPPAAQITLEKACAYNLYVGQLSDLAAGFYDTTVGGTTCWIAGTDNGDGTATLNVAIPDNSWFVLSESTILGESSVGLDSDGTERTSMGVWTLCGPTF